MAAARTIRIASVNRARARELLAGERRVLSAIAKQPVMPGEAVAVGPLGLEGDEQADLSAHGGLDKALYAYPSEHYPFWQTLRAQAGAAAWGQALAPGALGENLTLAGVLESELWIGDRLHLPDCVLAVSAPRRPCFKLDAVMGFAQASRMMVQSGWCGSYLAVIEPGSVRAGDRVELRPGPREVSLRELFKARARA
ncbi:MAG: MOSC domain-containing protein [Rubrivivax sp.]